MCLLSKSHCTTKWFFGLSRLPSLLIFTLNSSITGMLISPSRSVSSTILPAPKSIFNSFLTDANHALRTTPSGISRMSLILRGVGSQECASPDDGMKCWCASAAQASKSSKSMQVLAHSTVFAREAYLGFGLWGRLEQRRLALESTTMGVSATAGGGGSSSSNSSKSSSTLEHKDGVSSLSSASLASLVLAFPSSTDVFQCGSNVWNVAMGWLQG